MRPTLTTIAKAAGTAAAQSNEPPSDSPTSELKSEKAIDAADKY